MSETLKPCPFCGGEKCRLRPGGAFGFVVECPCGARTIPWDLQHEAVIAWNRRADDWISVEEREPTKEDAFEGDVEVWHPAVSRVVNVSVRKFAWWKEQMRIKWWRRIVPPQKEGGGE